MQPPCRTLPGEGKLVVVNLLLCPAGVWNDNPEDDFRMPNGSTIPSNSSEETLFHYGMTCELGGSSGHWAVSEGAAVLPSLCLWESYASLVRSEDFATVPCLSPACTLVACLFQEGKRGVSGLHSLKQGFPDSEASCPYQLPCHPLTHRAIYWSLIPPSYLLCYRAGQRDRPPWGEDRSSAYQVHPHLFVPTVE